MPAFEPRYGQGESSSINEAPAGVGQVNQVLGSVIGDSDVIKNASQEVSR